MPLLMQLIMSFDQRSPHRFVVTGVSATSLTMAAISRARGESLPSSSPILNPGEWLSVRTTLPGSWHAPPMMTIAPSVRSRPTISAIRSSLTPFWKQTNGASEVA